MGRSKKKGSRQSKENQSAPPARHHEEDNRLGSSVTPSTADPPIAASLMQCDICQELFNEQRNKPKNLQCGHSFCNTCCSKLLEQGTIKCPKCREVTRVRDVDELPFNYPVLNMMREMDIDNTGAASMKKGTNDKGSPQKWGTALSVGHQKKEPKSPHGGKCLEAQAEVAMHCAHCDLWLCKDCSRIDHKHSECVLMPYQDTLKEKSQTGKAKIKATEQILEDFYDQVNAFGGQLSSCAIIMGITLDCIKKVQNQLPGILIHCGKLKENLSDIAVKPVPTFLEDALCYLDSLEMATQATKQWTDNGSNSLLKVDQVFKLSKILLQTAVQLHTTTGHSIMGLHSINGTDVALPVDINGSRLLVHAVQGMDLTADYRLIKLAQIKSCIDPTCALTFLDISLRGQELGRVFIRLLGKTKLSQCFLMMCTGEAGPSFRNTPFHRMCWSGQPGEHLWCGDYNFGDGSGGDLPRTVRDQTKELSNKKTRVPISAGLIAGRYGNHNSTIFRVYTRDSSDVVEEFAFGRVEYGLEVFKDALKKHSNNITHVTISDCGVVIEP